MVVYIVPFSAERLSVRLIIVQAWGALVNVWPCTVSVDYLSGLALSLKMYYSAL